MTDKEVMQMALDALESLQAWPETPENFNRVQAIGTLRAALAQPEREWQGLTAEELAEIAEFHFHGGLSGREFYDDIEAKLKEKNT